MKKISWFVVFIGCCFVYCLLAWRQFLPSVFHTSSIRKVWDAHFRECIHHTEHEKSLQRNHHKLFLTFSLHGRLGNWMFAYASTLGIANANNRLVYLPENHALTEIFNIKNTATVLPKCIEVFQESLPCAYDPRMENLPEVNVTLQEYLQSWRYFENVSADVRNQFQFHPWIYEDAIKIFLYHKYGESQMDVVTNRKSDLLTVCVHVRRTDMMIPTSTKLGFKAAPLLYIKNAQEHMRSKFKDTALKFLVVSDDYAWCYENLLDRDTVIIPPNDIGIHLAILTLCNHSIITTGTYGWWGAYLAGGYSVYYKNFPEPGSKLDRNTVHADYYPPEWVGLDSADTVYTSSSLSLMLIIILIHILFYKYSKIWL